MVIDIYSFKISTPCKGVLLTAKAIGVELNIKETNPAKDEQYAPEFLKLNPLHVLPTIVDNGFVLCESRAIMQYLCNQYAPNSTIYPSDPKKRAFVDRWLNLDVMLYTAIRHGLLTKKFLGVEPPQPTMDGLKSNLKVLNDQIGDKKYITGEHLTIADLSILANAWVLIETGFDLTDYPNFKRWILNFQTELPYFKEVMLTVTKQDLDEWAQNKTYVKRLLSGYQ